MDINKQIIWIFTEPRSGSTWFSQTLAILLNRNLHPRDKGLDSKDNKQVYAYAYAL